MLVKNIVVLSTRTSNNIGVFSTRNYNNIVVLPTGNSHRVCNSLCISVPRGTSGAAGLFFLLGSAGLVAASVAALESLESLASVPRGTFSPVGGGGAVGVLATAVVPRGTLLSHDAHCSRFLGALYCAQCQNFCRFVAVLLELLLGLRNFLRCRTPLERQQLSSGLKERHRPR